MFKIYMSRAMQDATIDEQNSNTDYIIKAVTNYVVDFNQSEKVKFFNPYEYYNYEYKNHITEKEIFRYELENVRNSSLIIYDEQGIKSIGASMELAIAYEHRIPILVLNKDNKPVHPWIEHVSNRIFQNVDELINFVIEYYLN